MSHSAKDETSLCENLEAPKVTSASEELEHPESHTLLWPVGPVLAL